MNADAAVSLTPKGAAVVEGLIDRALEVACPKCGAKAGYECEDEPTGVHIERLRASRPLKVACPKCDAPVGLSCFEAAVAVHEERTAAYAEVRR